MFDSYEELLKEDMIDAVYISLPNSLHKEWIIKSLHADKHVLCEKPLSLMEEDVVEIESLAKEKGKKVLEGFMYRHTEKTKFVQDKINSGIIGKIKFVQSNFFSLRTRAKGIRIEKALGGGSLWDLGSYSINLYGMLMGGTPKSINALSKIENEVDTYLSGQIMTDEEGLFVFSCGWINDDREMTTIIMGTEGTIKINKLFNAEEEHLEIMVGGKVERFYFPSEDPFEAEISAFNNSIKNNIDPELTLQETAKNIKLCREILNTARKN